MRQCQVSITAQLYGGFSFSEYAYQASHIKHGAPKQGAELICYRRNLFQVTGSVTLPPGIRYIISPEGNRIPILAQELTVCAIETVEGKSIETRSLYHTKSLVEDSIVNPTTLGTAPRRFRWTSSTWTPEPVRRFPYHRCNFNFCMAEIVWAEIVVEQHTGYVNVSKTPCCGQQISNTDKL